MIEGQLHRECLVKRMPCDRLHIVGSDGRERGTQSARPDGIHNLSAWVAFWIGLNCHQLHGFGRNFEPGLFSQLAGRTLFKRSDAWIKEPTDQPPRVGERFRARSPPTKQYVHRTAVKIERDD